MPGRGCDSEMRVTVPHAIARHSLVSSSVRVRLGHVPTRRRGKTDISGTLGRHSAGARPRPAHLGLPAQVSSITARNDANVSVLNESLAAATLFDAALRTVTPWKTSTF